jgi:hypothetical protein
MKTKPILNAFINKQNLMSKVNTARKCFFFIQNCNVINIARKKSWLSFGEIKTKNYSIEGRGYNALVVKECYDSRHVPSSFIFLVFPQLRKNL